MLNDRDEKYEAPEESEYHFSEDDVSYEVEPETPKAAATETKINILNRLTRSKRMLISLAVFFVLVFVVYKMVAPSTSTSTAEILPPHPVATQTPISAQPGGYAQTPAVSQSLTTTESMQQPQPPPMMTTPPSLSQNAAQPQPTQALTAPVQTYPQQQGYAQQAVYPPNMQPTTSMPSMVQQPPATMVPPSAVAAPSQPQMVLQPPQPTMQQPPMNSQQPVMVPPAQTITPGYAAQPSATSSLSAQVPGGIDGGIAAVSAANQQMMGQLQAEYAQRMTEYASQNKNLTDQVHALNTRVASMEAEMHKLLQALTRQAPPQTHVVAPPRPQANEPRIAYNVQAIIPGRAWLRSDSGETVTVAEGDMIKNVGRVVKIDPYDGVVEINTGNKVVSLSYGNGG